MSSVKTILAGIVVVFILVSCGGGAPATTLNASPTATRPATASPTPAPTLTPTPAPTIAPTPAPRDVPVFRTSFEDIPNPAAKGITSTANVEISSENVNYADGAMESKDLKVSGTLAGAQWSNLAADFSMKKLVGEDSVDFSNKTVEFSLFLPQGSPIHDVELDVRKGNKTVQLTSALRIGLDLQGKGWVDFNVDVGKEYTDKSWGYTNTTSDDEAREVIKTCDTLSISGFRATAGTSADTQFYLDDLNWIGIDKFNLPLNDSVDSLRKYAANKHFKFGLYPNSGIVFGPGGTNPWPGDPWYAYLAAQEGAVNVVWPFSSKANEDYSNFDFDRPEDAPLTRQYQYGAGNQMAIQGYGEGSIYSTAPQFLQDLAFPDATNAFLLYHIEKDLRYAKGKNPIWLLFNESINASTYGENGLKNRQNPFGVNLWDYSPWAADTTDTSLIEAAFLKARQVDPGATLMVNDFNNEQIGMARSEFEYQLVSGLQAKGIPIDGVGFQLHNYINPDGKLTYWLSAKGGGSGYWVSTDLDTYLKNVDLNVKRYASIGMKVAFTEAEGQVKLVDIDFSTQAGRSEYDKRLQWQAKYYAGLMKIALENKNVILFNIWGVTDKDTALGYPGFGNGFIFDKNYNPKPAYYAMLELLKNDK